MFLLWVGLHLAGRAGAQDLNVRHFEATDGFPIEDVRDLAQDPSGRLWMASGSGLRCFDGRSVHEIELGDDMSWAAPAALRFDGAGTLWVVADRSPFPVLRRRNGAFEALPLISGAGSDDEIVGLEISGNAPDPGIAVATGAGVWLWSGAGDWRHLTSVEGLPGRQVRALASWRGRLVVAGDQGLAVIRSGVVDPGLGRRLADDKSRNILALAVDPRPMGDLWVVADHWLGLQSESDFRVVALAVPWQSGSEGGALPGPVSASADGLGGLYVSVGPEVYYFHVDRGWERLTALFPLHIGSIRVTRVDHEGSAWLGGAGVAQIAGRRLRSYRRDSGLLADAVTSLALLRDDTVLVGHQGGVSSISEQGIETRALPLASADGRRLEHVRGAAQGDDGEIWLALGELGVGRLDGESFHLETDPRFQGALGLAVEPLRRELWVATPSTVWRRSRTGQWEGVPQLQTEVDDGLGAVQALRADGHGVWVLRQGGLSLVSSESVRHWYLRRPGVELWDAVWSGDGPERVWAATEKGLFVAPFGEESLQPVAGAGFAVRAVGWSPPDGVDPHGYLWLGTRSGVRRYDPVDNRLLEPLWHHAIMDRAVSRRGFMADHLGRRWIGTDQGVAVFDPQYAHSVGDPPAVTIVSVVAGDQEWSLDIARRLPSGADQIAFNIEAVSLLAGDPMRFRSRLVGRDDVMSAPYAVPTRSIRFFDLQPGTYRLRLQAMDSSGTWGEVVESPAVVLSGPFWQQTWFFAVIGLGVLVGLYFLQGFFSQRRHSLLLEKEVALRVAELQASEDRYRKTFRTIEDGVVTTDEHGRVALLNPRAQELTGWSEPDAVGTGIDDVLRLFQQGVGNRGGTELSLLSGDLQDTIGPTQTAFLESRIGNRRLVELAASPIVSRGAGFAGMVFTFRDISRKREMEAELARAHKLEAIGLLAGGIAHDFNNLLTVILGNLSLLQDSLDLDDAFTGILHDAENALMRARDLTQQLLTFSRGGAPVRETASISEVIQDSASFVLSGSKTRCEIDLQENLHVVEIDAGQISQVLNNLLINATQAMPDGGLVRIVGRNVVDPPHPLKSGAYVAIDVSDTGIGIAEHLIHRIFDPYFSTKQEGRGLGLASAYSIIKSHDGLLTVQSALGEGTTFRLLLPASDKALVVRDEVPASLRRRWDGRILVMDDDPVVRRTTAVMLERLGFEVVSAVDGHQALNLYARNMEAETPFIAVMMDLTVPGGMGGQECIQHILQLDPDVRGIVYSGYSNDPVLANYRHYGFKGRLSKPFRLKDLQEVLGQVLRTETVGEGDA